MGTYDLKDADGLKTWILIQFGAPVVKVELAQEHLDACFDDAVRWFTAKKGMQKQGFIRLTPGQSVYPLPDDVDTICDVAFPASHFDYSFAFAPWLLPEQQIPASVFSAHGQSGGIYSNWTQALQYIDMAKKVLSAEADWRQEGRLLYLFAVKGLSGSIVIDYKTNSFTVEQLNERDHDLLKRYALAKAMMILGRIRSKYDGYPTAQGTVTLDGSQLLSDAQAMLEALETEIAGSGYPMGFLVG